MYIYCKNTNVSLLIGHTIRTMRKERQLTQEDLSGLADIGTPYISNIENGIANLSLKKICALAEALDVTPADLFPKSGGSDND